MIIVYCHLSRYDEIKEVIRVLKNSQKIKDIAKVQTGLLSLSPSLSPSLSLPPPPSITHTSHTVYVAGFDSLQKVFLKAKAVIDKELETPRFFIRALMELEDYVKDVSVCEYECCSVFAVKSDF